MIELPVSVGNRQVFRRIAARIQSILGSPRRVRELQDKLDERNRILSTIAHELRTPLTVMQTTTALLLEEGTGPLTER